MHLVEGMYCKYKLLAPPSFWEASDKERERVSNGCGPKGAGWLIPDRFLGCVFTPACDIHDWMYSDGLTNADRKQADIVFLNNMMRIVDAKGSFFRWARLQRAFTYYRFVRDCGHAAFWKGKGE